MSWGRERAFDDMSRVLKCSRIVIVMMTRWRAAVDEEWCDRYTSLVMDDLHAAVPVMPTQEV